jgi:UDP-galactose transporter B1
MLKRPGVKNQQRPPTAVETMLYINIYSLFLLIPLAVVSGQMAEGIRLLTDSEQLRINLAILNGVVSIGQIFIFLCISWYSSLVTTTITTTRKFFTILFSVVYFGHSFTLGQWMSVLMVFGGLYLSIASGNKSRVSKPISEDMKVD